MFLIKTIGREMKHCILYICDSKVKYTLLDRKYRLASFMSMMPQTGTHAILFIQYI